MKVLSAHSTKPTTSVCLLSGEPENNICPTSRMSFQTCLPHLKPGGECQVRLLFILPFHSFPHFKWYSGVPGTAKLSFSFQIDAKVYFLVPNLSLGSE